MNVMNLQFGLYLDTYIARALAAWQAARAVRAQQRALNRASHLAATRLRSRKGPTPRCGARRKYDGLPCQAQALPKSGRCRLHGGLSTGPKTPSGKARALANLRVGRTRAWGEKR